MEYLLIEQIQIDRVGGNAQMQKAAQKFCDGQKTSDPKICEMIGRFTSLHSNKPEIGPHMKSFSACCRDQIRPRHFEAPLNEYLMHTSDHASKRNAAYDLQ